MPHYDNHASFAYCVSPFARSEQPVMILVSDGAGDCASISLYLGKGGSLRLLRHNGSFFGFYGVIGATQGGWTHLSSEGRYMGAEESLLLGAYVIYAIALRLSIDELIAPIVLSRAGRLHPVLIIFCFLAGGILFGIPGVILAVPAALTVKVVPATV